MKHTVSDVQHLIRRIEHVEKQNRRIKGLALVLGIVLIAVMGIGATAMQDGNFRKITVQEVVVVDKMGKNKIHIGTSDEGSGVKILNNAGKRVIGLGLSTDEQGNGIVIADNSGMPRLGLGMEEGIPSMAITTSQGKKVLGIGGDKDGYGFVVMDANEVERVGMGVDAKGNSGFVIYDDKGQYVRGMIRQGDGVHYSSYMDEKGNEVVHR